MALGNLPALMFLLFCSFGALQCAKNIGEDNSLDLEEIEKLNWNKEDSVKENGRVVKQEYLDIVGEDEERNVDEYEEEGSIDVVDEKNVVILSEGNFSRFVRRNKLLVVEFYAPWCRVCRAFAPEYAAAATELKGQAIFAKLDATQSYDLNHKYNVHGFPTIFLFMDRNQKLYTGENTKEDIVRWVRRKIGPAVFNVTTTEEAENMLDTDSTIAVALLDTLEGPESNVVELVARQEDYVLFYKTTSEDVAAVFGIDRNANRPTLVLLKKEPEKITHFEGKFDNGTLFDFIIANKLPLVTNFTSEISALIFESPVQKQLILFLTDEDYKKIMPDFQEAAKSFKGKIIFLRVDSNNEDGKSIMEYFGLGGVEPRLMAYTDIDDTKHLFEGNISLDNIKRFAENFLANKLKPFYKSEPIPEKNDGDVTIVVGNNFDEIVLDESKDVLLEIYAPWCEHCQKLEPVYTKLAEHLRGVESLVIAKIDATKNEHARLRALGFPTLLLYTAGNKSFDPIPVDSDRTVEAFYRFLKKHVAIPFKLPQKDNAIQDINVTDQPKDEL